MDQQLIDQYKAEYAKKTPGEIFDLWERQKNLVEEAQAALTHEIRDRQIDIRAIANADLIEQDELTQAEEVREEKSRRRSNLFLKIFFAITIPIALIHAFTTDHPGDLLVAGISSAVQGLLLALICWGVMKLTKKQKR